MVSLKIAERRNLTSASKLIKSKDECNQLISIFVKSIETAKKSNIKA